jgi:hypothetical protein
MPQDGRSVLWACYPLTRSLGEQERQAMSTAQPNWKLLRNLGDASPVDHGGYFVYTDETGVYPPEAEVLVSPDDDEGGEWMVYRFPLERCTYIDGILSDNKFHPAKPAWFATLADVASSMDTTEDELIEQFTSDDPLKLAEAYRAVGDHHGFENFDSYPLTFTDRAEVEERYDLGGDNDMSVRQIRTEHVRAHELSDRAVKCPNALDHDQQTRYGVKAKTGAWVTYKETYTDGSSQTRHGRVLGRVAARAIADDVKDIDGHLSVLALSDNMQHAYIRWIDPKDVTEVSVNPPAALLAWVLQPQLPDADMVHKLSAYGTLSSSYINLADHHINAWKHGVSPAAWDAGLRSPEAVEADRTKPLSLALRQKLDICDFEEDMGGSWHCTTHGCTLMRSDWPEKPEQCASGRIAKQQRGEQ